MVKCVEDMDGRIAKKEIKKTRKRRMSKRKRDATSTSTSSCKKQKVDDGGDSENDTDYDDFSMEVEEIDIDENDSKDDESDHSDDVSSRLREEEQMEADEILAAQFANEIFTTIITEDLFPNVTCEYRRVEQLEKINKGSIYFLFIF